MRKVKAEPSSESPKRMRPALTPDARENQLISLAMDLVERRLLEGTASSQETTHFLKLASSKERLEKEKLENQNELLKAQAEAVKSAQHGEEIYSKALDAMRRYSGHGDSEEL